MGPVAYDVVLCSREEGLQTLWMYLRILAVQLLEKMVETIAFQIRENILPAYDPAMRRDRDAAGKVKLPSVSAAASGAAWVEKINMYTYLCMYTYIDRDGNVGPTQTACRCFCCRRGRRRPCLEVLQGQAKG